MSVSLRRANRASAFMAAIARASGVGPAAGRNTRLTNRPMAFLLRSSPRAAAASGSTGIVTSTVFVIVASVARISPFWKRESSLLVDADDQVAVADLLARHLDLARRVELPQQQRVALPAEKLLDQHRLVRLVDDDVAAADRRLERVDVQEPALLITRLHRIADHVD